MTMKCFALAAFAVMFAAGLAWSQEIPDSVKMALDAIVAAKHIKAECPAYRVNLVALLALMKNAGLDDASSISAPYKKYYDENSARADQRIGMSHEVFCDYIFDYYQSNNSNIHLIEKR